MPGCVLIELHKVISKWLSTHDDEDLISILKPFEILQKYLDYVELGVGEDLAILLLLAKNLERCKKVGIANGLKMLSLAVFEELVEGVQRKQVEQKPSSDPQSKDDAVKVEVESADESEGHLPEKKPAKKQRQACHLPAKKQNLDRQYHKRKQNLLRPTLVRKDF